MPPAIPAPHIDGKLRHRGRLARECASGIFPTETRRVAIFREGCAGDPPPNIRGGSRPGGECPSGTPPADPRPVPSARERCAGDPRQNIRGCSRPGGGCASRRPSPRASSRGPRQGDVAGDPPLNIHGEAIVWGEDAPPVPFLPNLLAWPSSGRGTPPATLPQIFAEAVVWGGGRASTEPRRATVARGQHVPPSLFRRTSSRARGLRPVGGRRRRRSSHDVQAKDVQMVSFICHLWCRKNISAHHLSHCPPPSVNLLHRGGPCRLGKGPGTGRPRRIRCPRASR